MRRRVFWSIVLVAVVTLAVGGLAGAVLINRSVEESARAEFARQAHATAVLVENEVGARGGVTSDIGRERLVEILSTAALLGGHEFVEAAFVGPRGTVASLTDGAALVDQVPGLSSLRSAVSFDAEVGGDSVLAVAQPFSLGDRGTLVIVIGTTLELVPWSDVLVRFAWALLIALLLAALLAGSMTRFVGRRLRHLHDASRDVADGDLTVRVPIEGDDEVAEVGVAFNEMAGQLEEARRREREFLVSVGHDLRTPLTTIAGYAEAMQEGRVTPDDLVRVAGVLGAESDRLRRLIEDLMLLARIEAREFSMRPERVDLAGHLKGVLEGFRGRAETAKVHLESDLADVGEVVVDPDRIAQVTGNLLENALRYTPEAGSVTLTLSAGVPGLVISVSDTGPGIEPEDVPHVFERLYVATRYRPVRPEGSGLGLSIVGELVAAMGGTADVATAPGGGTTISVTIPSG